MGRDPSGTSDLRVAPGPAASLSRFLAAPETCRFGSHSPAFSPAFRRLLPQLLGTTALWGLVEPLGSEAGFWNP